MPVLAGVGGPLQVRPYNVNLEPDDTVITGFQKMRIASETYAAPEEQHCGTRWRGGNVMLDDLDSGVRAARAPLPASHAPDRTPKGCHQAGDTCTAKLAVRTSVT